VPWICFSLASVRRLPSLLATMDIPPIGGGLKCGGIDMAEKALELTRMFEPNLSVEFLRAFRSGKPDDQAPQRPAEGFIRFERSSESAADPDGKQFLRDKASMVDGPGRAGPAQPTRVEDVAAMEPRSCTR